MFRLIRGVHKIGAGSGLLHYHMGSAPPLHPIYALDGVRVVARVMERGHESAEPRRLLDVPERLSLSVADMTSSRWQEKVPTHDGGVAGEERQVARRESGSWLGLSSMQR